MVISIKPIHFEVAIIEQFAVHSIERYCYLIGEQQLDRSSKTIIDYVLIYPN